MSRENTMPALVNYAAEPGSVELREVDVPDIKRAHPQALLTQTTAELDPGSA